MTVLAEYQVTTTAVYVEAGSGDSELRLVTNLKGDTLYYKSGSTVTSTSNDGGLAQGQSVQISTGTSFVSATRTNVTVEDVTPELREDVTDAVHNVRDYGAVCDGSVDDSDALEAAQAAMRASGGIVEIPGRLRLTRQLKVMGGDDYRGTGYFGAAIEFDFASFADRASTTTTGSVASNDTTLAIADRTLFPTEGTVVIDSEAFTYTGLSAGTGTTGTLTGLIRTTAATTHSSGATVHLAGHACILPRDPTDFTESVSFRDLAIRGDSRRTGIGCLMASSRKWNWDNVEFQGSSVFTRHSLYLYGQRWVDGSATLGGGTPKTTLSSDVTASATTIPVADTSQYQPGNRSTSYIKLVTSVTTTNTVMDNYSKTVGVADRTNLPSAGAVTIGGEMIFYTGLTTGTGTTGTLTGCIRSGTRANHGSGTTVYISELVYYTGTTSTTFTGCSRAQNGTTAYAHTSGGNVFQNPGDSTFSVAKNMHFLSGRYGQLRLGGTAGTARLNGGTSNMNKFQGFRCTSATAESATRGLWMEQGSANLFSGFTSNQSVVIEWYGNHVLGLTVGEADTSRYGVDITNQSESHDNVVDILMIDNSSNPNWYRDQTTTKRNTVRGYQMGHTIQRDTSGQTTTSTGALGVDANGHPYFYDGTSRWRFPRPIARTADSSDLTLQGTPQSDDTLLWAIQANEIWGFEGRLFFNGANTTMDGKIGWSVPTGATMLWDLLTAAQFLSVGVGSSPTNSLTEGSTRSFGTGAGITFGLALSGVVIADSSHSGNVNLQWSQATSDAGALVLKKGSSLRVWRLA